MDQKKSKTTITKICSDPHCEKKGQPQPVENFYKNKSLRDGLFPKCKKCHNKNKAQHKRIRTTLRKGPQVKAIERNNNKNLFLIIDFSNYLSVLEQLREVAIDEMRTIENQVIYSVKKYIENRGGD